MSTKEILLELLESRQGQFLSGAEIASGLQVSRTAIWKAMKALREDGYEIRAVQNKGYCLSEDTDILSAERIRGYLAHGLPELHMEVLMDTASTNALAREKAGMGAPEGTVILAKHQSAGRGRFGRKFYSPADSGIYLSLILRPKGYSPRQAIKVTAMAAVAVCRAIADISGKECSIKWVNDIFMDGRKVCGILTEGSFDLESGTLDSIVLGVGINVYEPEGGFPEELSSVAGAVFHSRVSDGRNRLTAAFLNRFMECYLGKEDFTEAYREKSMIIGRDIDVISAAGVRSARALDVDRDCHLIVRYENGEIAQLSSAEVSVRERKGKA